MSSSDNQKYLKAIVADGIKLKKHKHRRLWMRLAFGFNATIYLLITVLFLLLTLSSFNVFDFNTLIPDSAKSTYSNINDAYQNYLETIKTSLGLSVDVKYIMIALTIIAFIFFTHSFVFKVLLSKLTYTARPVWWLSTSIFLLPLIIPFIICLVISIIYLKDEHWKETRKLSRKTLIPQLASIQVEYEKSIKKQELVSKRAATEYDGFENLSKMDGKQKVAEIDKNRIKELNKEKDIKRKARLEEKRKQKQEKVDQAKEKKTEESTNTTTTTPNAEPTPVEKEDGVKSVSEETKVEPVESEFAKRQRIEREAEEMRVELNKKKKELDEAKKEDATKDMVEKTDKEIKKEKKQAKKQEKKDKKKDKKSDKKKSKKDESE